MPDRTLLSRSDADLRAVVPGGALGRFSSHAAQPSVADVALRLPAGGVGVRSLPPFRTQR